MRKLNVLIACECSGRIRDAWRDAGHNAWSCDLLGPDSAPDGFTPAEWADTWRSQRWANYHLEGNAAHWTTPIYPDRKACGPDGVWDVLIAHPPCTYLTNAGVRWLYEGKDTNGYPATVNKQRWNAMYEAAAFFAQLWRSPIPYKAIENPIMHKYARIAIETYTKRPYLPKPQIVQPWMFGDAESKATCLWLDNLPPLIATHKKPGLVQHRVHKLGPSPARWYWRSLTPCGFAKATLQWANYIQASEARS